MGDTRRLTADENKQTLTAAANSVELDPDKPVE